MMIHCESVESEGLPIHAALNWAIQLAGALVHCHAFGAVHGQLHPENLLLKGEVLQVVGFYCCAPPILPPDGPLSENASSPPISPTEPSTDQRVELRPYDAIDAPELHRRTHAFGSELASCDIWALAVLLNWLLTGKPMTAPPASASPIDGISGTQAGDRSPVASRSTQTEYAGDTLESIAVGPHHPLHRQSHTNRRGGSQGSASSNDLCGSDGGNSSQSCGDANSSQSGGGCPSLNSNSRSTATSCPSGGLGTTASPGQTTGVGERSPICGPTSSTVSTSTTPADGWQSRKRVVVDVSDDKSQPPAAAAGAAVPARAHDAPVDPPQDLSRDPSSVPDPKEGVNLPALHALLARMLQQEPSCRPTAYEVLTELQGIAPQATAAATTGGSAE